MSRPHACREYAQQISAGHDSGYFKKLTHAHCVVHSQLIEFSEGVRQVSDLAAMVEGHEFRLQQILDGEG